MTPGKCDSRLSTVQALRGIAASLVVFFHFADIPQTGKLAPSWIHDSGLGNLGACGVDIFFIISGFIIVYATQRKSGKQDALAFLIKRICRIYPLYWLWTTLLLALWMGGVGQRLQHISVLYVVTSYLLLPFFNGLDCHPLLGQGWTLSFEMYFYLVFSCGVSLKLRSCRLPFLFATFVVLAMLGTLLMAGSGARYVLCNPIMIEFLLGGLAAELMIRVPTLSRYRWARTASVVLISLGVVALVGTIRLHDVYPLRFLFYGIPAFCIVLGAVLLGPVSAPNLLVYLGDCSYSIYIAHAFTLTLFAFILKHFALYHLLRTDTAIVLGGSATIAISSLSYSLVERPLARWTRVLSARASTIGRHHGAEAAFHSAWSTVEKSSRPTVVNITS